MMVLDVRRDDAVLEVTFDRPDALNAFTAELHEELADALAEARNPSVRAVLLTGAGRAFSAGQDLAEAQASGIGPGERLRRFYNPNIRAIRALDRPIVAAINGVAAGAGIGIALACDVRVASRRASFVPAFVTIGLVPDSGLSWTATRLLGEARAYEWLMSNRRLDAATALEWGLVHEVVEPDAVLDHARQRAAALAAVPGLAGGLTKRLILAAATTPLDEHLELECELQQRASEDPAYVASVAAFLDRSG